MNKFVIKKGCQYVKFDKKHRVVLTTISKADLFDYPKAVSLIENSIAKKERKFYEVIELSPSEMKSINKDEIASTTVKTQISISEICDNFEELCFGLPKVIPNLQECKAEFVKRLSLVDMKLSDILHRIEKPKDNGKEFNASEMYSFAKMLRDLRRERRVIKNNLLRINCLLGIVKQDTNTPLDEQFSKITNSIYKPRVLTDLF